MNAGSSATKTIAIIGGGVSGALAAYHLTLQHVNADVIVIDPRPELGLGLAYSTPSLRHLLNVPACKISALPMEPSIFWNGFGATSMQKRHRRPSHLALFLAVTSVRCW
jgi:hydroxyacylglutathione hydrolase